MAIAKLWPIALCFVIPLIIIVFRKQLIEMLSKIKKLKAVGTEVELRDNAESNSIKQISPGQITTPDTTPPSQITLSEENQIESLPKKIVTAILARKTDEAEKLFQEQKNKDPGMAFENELFFLEMKCSFLKDSKAAARLEELKLDTRSKEHLESILWRLVRYYIATEQYEKAIGATIEVETISKRSYDKADSIATRSRIFNILGKTEKSLNLLIATISKVDDQSAKALLYTAIAETHKQIGNKLEYAVALEKAIEFDAANTKSIFNAAYAQAEPGQLPYLGLHNYFRELTLTPDHAAMNNSGVLFAELGLPINSVEQYKKAELAGETLAMANLANLYIDRGFIEDAEKLLRNAKKTEGYHPDIDNATVRITHAKKQEETKFKDISNWGRTYQEFIRNFSDALFFPPIKFISFDGQWEDPHGIELTIIQSGNQFKAEWTSDFRKKISGTQTNRAAKGHYSYSTEGLSLLSYTLPNQWDIICYLSSDGNKINIISLGKEMPITMSFTRKSPLKAISSPN